jgi:hypothetical protein
MAQATTTADPGGWALAEKLQGVPDLQTAWQCTAPQAGVHLPSIWQWGVKIGDTPHRSWRAN